MNLITDFERFQRASGQGTSMSPFVTIQRSGRVMTINRVAYEMLNSPEAVELLFSKKNRVIGLRAASKKESFALPLRPQGRKGRRPSNYLVTVERFIKHYGIEVSGATRYPVEMQDDTLVVDLKQDGQIVAKRPGRRPHNPTES